MSNNLIVREFSSLLEEAINIWLSGGWGMIALSINAFLLYGLGVHIFLKLKKKGILKLSKKKIDRWVKHSQERTGDMGNLLSRGINLSSIKECMNEFKHFSTNEIIPFERDLKVMKTCVAAAPLLGLLGTVTGMLSTFDALSVGSGGDKTMGLVAKGISEALITTETGLVIALPGLFFQYILLGQYDRYKNFLAHLETICTQNIYKRTCRGKGVLANSNTSKIY